MLVVVRGDVCWADLGLPVRVRDSPWSDTATYSTDAFAASVTHGGDEAPLVGAVVSVLSPSGSCSDGSARRC